jgi:ferredoxin
MADKDKKTASNVPGPFFVDESCIGCEACVDEAPENFRIGDDSLAFVFKQPEEPGEREACESALDACPVQAIGKEG